MNMLRKVISLLTSLSVLLSAVLLGATPASAQCIAQYPTIGTIRSLSTRGLSDTGAAHLTYLALDHAATFNPDLFSSGTTPIDQYNTLAMQFKQNNYQVPAAYAPTPEQKTYYPSNSTDLQIGAISLNALKTISYHIGDIVIMGPPHGGACDSY